MLSIVPALVAGGASLLGGVLANRANKRESRRNRQFQAEQSSTAWQRSVKDMEAAGLNPALAYSQGPASSPGGSMASQGDVISPAVSSAMAATAMRKNLKLQDEQIQKAREEQAFLRAQTRHEDVKGRVANLQRDLWGRFDGERWVPGPLTREIEHRAEQARLLLPEQRATARAFEENPGLALTRIISQSGGGGVLGTLLGGGLFGLGRIANTLPSRDKRAPSQFKPPRR